MNIGVGWMGELAPQTDQRAEPEVESDRPEGSPLLRDALQQFGLVDL